MKKILCYGDSNTWGYDPRKTTPEVMARYEDTVRWTGRLEMELGKDYRVIEAGYCGRTTVFDDPLVSHCNGFSFLEPVFNASYPIDWCVIMLGTNELKKVRLPCVCNPRQRITRYAGRALTVRRRLAAEFRSGWSTVPLVWTSTISGSVVILPSAEHP